MCLLLCVSAGFIHSFLGSDVTFIRIIMIRQNSRRRQLVAAAIKLKLVPYTLSCATYNLRQFCKQRVNLRLQSANWCLAARDESVVERRTCDREVASECESLTTRSTQNTPCLKKTVQTYFLSELWQISTDCKNFFGTKIAERTSFSGVYSLSPHLIYVNALPCETHMFKIVTQRCNY